MLEVHTLPLLLGFVEASHDLHVAFSKSISFGLHCGVMHDMLSEDGFVYFVHSSQVFLSPSIFCVELHITVFAIKTQDCLFSETCKPLVHNSQVPSGLILYYASHLLGAHVNPFS